MAKDWWDMSQETAWYRGEFPDGLQIGEPFPNSHVRNIFNQKFSQQSHNFITKLKYYNINIYRVVQKKFMM